MSGSIFQIGTYLLAGILAGAGIGWLLRGMNIARQLDKVTDSWQIKYDEAVRQRDKLSTDNIKFRTSIEAQQAMVAKHELAASRGRTELESAREKIKSLGKDLFEAGAERDQIRSKVNENLNALNAAKRQVADLEAEFLKAGDFYKGELQKALEKRRTLETKVDDAKAEHESLNNLLLAARSETESVNKMLASAHTRLDNLDAIENRVIELEAENAQLRHDAAGLKQDVDALQRDVVELDSLKVQNRELAHCLKSMENSRQQYEVDAKRYREQAGQSEILSETLRVKLDDVEKHLAEMARQHDEARKHTEKSEAAAKTNGHAEVEPEKDDLTEIVGIGKVFQHTLHELGVFSFRQIANFGRADIARVNMALKECRGRMEQDDWIGQAKELHFKKYGATSSH